MSSTLIHTASGLQLVNYISKVFSVVPLKRQDWNDAVPLLADISLYINEFYSLWPQYMYAAGFLSFIAPRRKDCLRSCNELIGPILQHHRSGVLPTLEKLCRNEEDWAAPYIQLALRHWQRGFNPMMFLSSFTTYIRALGDALDTLPNKIPNLIPQLIQHARAVLEIYGMAIELICMEACLKTSQQERLSAQEEANRSLAFEKVRVENILNAIPDCVIAIDGDCRISTINSAMKRHIPLGLEGQYVWKIPGIESNSKEEFFKYYPAAQPVEVTPFNDDQVFRLLVAPLGDVGLDMVDGYLVFLVNVTPEAKRQEVLEDTVMARTADLEGEKQRLEEMNITLRNVLQSIHKEQDVAQKELSEAIRNFVVPSVSRIAREEDMTSRLSDSRILIGQLDRLLQQPSNTQYILTGKTDEPGHVNSLTLSELKICQLLQAGHHTKEIASILSISPETVQTHRKKIRRKLGLRGDSAQLAVFLQTQKL